MRQSQKLVLNLANVTFLILEHLPSKPSIVTTIKPHCTVQSSAKGWGEGRSGVLVYRVVLKGLVAKLGTGFVANNPLSPPPLPAPSLPLNYNCTKARSIICTAVRVAAIIPPTFSGSGGTWKLACRFFHPFTRNFGPSPQPFSHGPFVIDSRGIFRFERQMKSNNSSSVSLQKPHLPIPCFEENTHNYIKGAQMISFWLWLKVWDWQKT